MHIVAAPPNAGFIRQHVVEGNFLPDKSGVPAALNFRARQCQNAAAGREDDPKDLDGPRRPAFKIAAAAPQSLGAPANKKEPPGYGICQRTR